MPSPIVANHDSNHNHIPELTSESADIPRKCNTTRVYGAFTVEDVEVWTTELRNQFDRDDVTTCWVCKRVHFSESSPLCPDCEPDDTLLEWERDYPGLTYSFCRVTYWLDINLTFIHSIAFRLFEELIDRATDKRAVVTDIYDTIMRLTSADVIEGEWMISHEFGAGETVVAQTFLRHMPYQAYLDTWHWILTRDNAIERAGNRCQVCNSPVRLDVHHRSYARRGCELPEDLTVLCRTCHETFHKNGRLAR